MPNFLNNSFRWTKFGGTGFAISVIVHGVLIIIAALWIVSRYEAPAAGKDPTVFSSGAGGGASGAQVKTYEHRITPKLARDVAETPGRITARGIGSGVVLPEMPAINMSALSAGNTRGGASKGAGGGAGGGMGIGTGIGVGGGKNYIGKFVMGTRIQARKIAVYLDCSSSMTHYLPRVKEEIYAQFPDADIFEHPGVRTTIRDRQVYMGRGYKGDEMRSSRSGASSARTFTDPEKLSAMGKVVFRKYKENFEKGSVGAWIDILCREKYDALVVFADFNDGVRQYNKAGVVIYADSRYSPKSGGRSRAEMEWEQNWVSEFKKTGAPKLYLFSIQTEPQQFLQALVGASGGETKMLPELREQTTRPPARRAAQGRGR